MAQIQMLLSQNKFDFINISIFFLFITSVSTFVSFFILYFVLFRLKMCLFNKNFNSILCPISFDVWFYFLFYPCMNHLRLNAFFCKRPHFFIHCTLPIIASFIHSERTIQVKVQVFFFSATSTLIHKMLTIEMMF